MTPDYLALERLLATWSGLDAPDPKWLATQVHERLFETFPDLDRRWTYLWSPSQSVRAGYGNCWSVCAESAPFEWALAAQTVPALADHPTVMVEAYNGFVLSFRPR